MMLSGAGIQPTQNKFSFLQVEDPDSDGQNHKTNHNVKQTALFTNHTHASSKNKKKRARKKKKKEEQTQTSSSIAALDDFSEPAPFSGLNNSITNEHILGDREFVEKQFYDEISHAIELSKQEYEKHQQTIHDDCSSEVVSPNLNNNEAIVPEAQLENSSRQKERAIKKEKKKKEKFAKTVSLEKFHQHIEESLPLKPDCSTTDIENKVPVLKTFKPPSTSTVFGDHFESIQHEVDKITHTQNIQSPTDAVNIESFLVNEKIAEQVKQKDVHICQLETEVESWKNKYNHVKKRNQQLLVILQQGEMKDKAEILVDLERLSMIRDELTTEITELHQSLEKERSKVSKLKEELKNVNRVMKKTSDD